MSKPPTIDRKELKTPDKFVTTGNQIMNSLIGHKRSIAIVGIGAVILMLGGYFYGMWQDNQSEKAWLTYYEAMKAPETEKWDKLTSAYNAGLYGRAGLFAAVGLADHYFGEAKKEALKDPKASPEAAAKAAEWYSKALTSADLLAAEHQLLLINRGEANELQKKLDEAQKDFEAAVDKGGDAKALALLGLGRILELKKDKPKAIETYEKLAADFNNTEYAKTAKGYLRRLKSPLFPNASL